MIDALEKEEEKKLPKNITQCLQTNWFEYIDCFDKMPIYSQLLQGMHDHGILNPTKIQQQCILPLLQKRNLITQAQFGSGKTTAQAISVLQIVDPNMRETQALIIAPIQELVQQFTNVLLKHVDLGLFLQVKVQMLIGCKNIQEKDNLKKRPHIVLGTPGRVLDMVQQGIIKIEYLKILVLDDMDEILCKGYKDQIIDTCKMFGKDTQIAIFSTFMPADIFEISKQFLIDPTIILSSQNSVIMDEICQYKVVLEDEESKLKVLVDLFIKIKGIKQSLIFCSTDKKVQDLTNELIQRQYSVSSLDGTLTSDERENILKEFRNGLTKILVLTDFKNQGYHFEQVSLVINYDIPISKEKYARRISESGRLGRKGVAINLVTQSNMQFVQEIELLLKIKIASLPSDYSNLLI